MEGHLRDAAAVDADRRQDPPRAHALAQSFLARRRSMSPRAGLTTGPIPDGARTVPDRFRLRRSRAVAAHQRRPFPPDRAQADAGRRILRRRDDRALASSASTCASTTMPNEIADAIPFDRGPRARVLRPPTPPTASGACCSRAHEVFAHFRTGFPRQGEPGAFLLGQLRSGGDALFRAARAAPSRRRAEPARRGGARGLFARGVERGLLAGRRRADRLSRRSTPTPIRRRTGFAAAKVRPAQAFFSKELGEFILPYDAVRTARDPRRRADGIPAEHLRGGGGSGAMGPRRAGVRLGRGGEGEGGVVASHPWLINIFAANADLLAKLVEKYARFVIVGGTAVHFYLPNGTPTIWICLSIRFWQTRDSS